MDILKLRELQKELLPVYLKWEQQIIPNKFRTKQPCVKDWPKIIIPVEELYKWFFNGTLYNFGIRLSEFFIDIDCDCPEAIIAAKEYLPFTATFGRQSARGSHKLYFSQGAKTKKYIFRGSMLLELRAEGQQTVLPGSLHKSGEVIEWETDPTPATISGEEARELTGKMAAAVAVSLFWTEGIRQKIAMSLSKILIDQNWIREEIEKFFTVICEVANDPDTAQRFTAITGTEKRMQAGKETAGIPKLEELTCKELVDCITDWLQITPKVYEFAEFKLNKDKTPDTLQKKKTIYDYVLQPGELNLREDWLINEVLAPETITTFFSRSGGGKSFIALLKSLFLLTTNKVDTVLYLDNDNSKRALKARHIEEITQLYSHKFLYFPSYKVDKNLIPTILEGMITENLGHCLIIIDSIRNFLEGDPNSDKDSIHFMDIIKDLRSRGNTIILLHHVNKQKEIKNNTSIVDYSDVVYEMTSENNKEENNIFLNFKIFKDRIGAREHFTGIINYKELSIKLEINSVDSEDRAVVGAIIECLKEGDKNQNDIYQKVKEECSTKTIIVNLLKRYTNTLWKYEKGIKNSSIYSLIENATPEQLLYYKLPIQVSTKFKLLGQLDNSIKSTVSGRTTGGQLDNSIKSTVLRHEEGKTANLLSCPSCPKVNMEQPLEITLLSSCPHNLEETFGQQKKQEDDITDVPF